MKFNWHERFSEDDGSYCHYGSIYCWCITAVRMKFCFAAVLGIGRAVWNGLSAMGAGILLLVCVNGVSSVLLLCLINKPGAWIA